MKPSVNVIRRRRRRRRLRRGERRLPSRTCWSAHLASRCVGALIECARVNCMSSSQVADVLV